MCSSDLVEYLISIGADMNSCTADGMTPLYWAAAKARLDVIECLVGYGADVNAGSSSGLRGAVDGWNPDAFELLVANGARINREDVSEEDNYLHCLPYFALLCDDDDDEDTRQRSPLGIVKYLIEEQGADPKDEFLGINLIKEAAVRNHWDVVAYLNNGVMPRLHQAAHLGDVETVRALLSSSRNHPIDALAPLGASPLQLAVKAGHTHVVRLLLEHGADATAKNCHATILHTATAKGSEELLRAVLNALKEKAEPELYIACINARCCEGDTPLHWCIEREQVDMARILLEYGADPLRILESGEIGRASCRERV